MDVGNLVMTILAILSGVAGLVGGAILWGKHIAETGKAKAETNGIRAETALTDAKTIREQSAEIARLNDELDDLRARAAHCSCGAMSSAAESTHSPR